MQLLTTEIEKAWKENRRVYGRPRIFAELEEDCEEVGEKRVGRLMKHAGIVGVSRRRRGPKTTNRDTDARPAPDLVERDFTAEGPDQLWVADITYIPTWAGSCTWRWSSTYGADTSSVGRWPHI